MPSAFEECVDELDSRGRVALDRFLRRSASSCDRPAFARIVPALGVGGHAAVTDFVRCPAVKGPTRAVLVVPGAVESDLASERISTVRGDEAARALGLRRGDILNRPRRCCCFLGECGEIDAGIR
jgi:hypothetical protein